MGWLLSAILTVTSSAGLAIILLSLAVFLVTRPLRRAAERVQQREIDIQRQMEAPIREAKARFKGEARFNEIERIYQQFGYHPIKSMRSTLVFVVQIPFLLSALFLLIDNPLLQGVPFLAIGDLGKPDQLLPLPLSDVFGVSSANLLPIAMLCISIAESFVARSAVAQANLRSNIIGVVIFVIVYSLPSALVLYWTCNNLWSLFAAVATKSQVGANATPSDGGG